MKAAESCFWCVRGIFFFCSCSLIYFPLKKEGKKVNYEQQQQAAN